MHLMSKNIYILQKYKNSECTALSKYVKYIFEKKKKYITVAHGSKRGGMTTCIIICLITVQANAYTYF